MSEDFLIMHNFCNYATLLDCHSGTECRMNVLTELIDSVRVEAAFAESLQWLKLVVISNVRIGDFVLVLDVPSIHDY